MKRSLHFRMPYLERGDILYRSDELQRWTALDANMGMVGVVTESGVVNGLDLTYAAESGTIVVSPGRYCSNSYWYTTTGNSYVSVVEDTNYTLYAYSYELSNEATDGSGVHYITNHPTFGVSETSIPTGAVDLGRVIVVDEVATLDPTTRKILSFGGRGLDNNYAKISNHIHDGSCPKIDLENHVTGILDQAYIGRIPGSKVDTGTLDNIALAGISHVGRVKEPFQFTTQATVPTNSDYTIYYTEAWTGDYVICKNGVAVSDSDIVSVTKEDGKIVFSASNSSSDEITVITDFKTLYTPIGSWDSDKTVAVYKNSHLASPSDYMVIPESAQVKFTQAIAYTDIVEVTIYGANVINVGNNTHDDIDYWIGENSSYMGWWPSFTTEFNLGQLAIQLDTYATCASDGASTLPNYQQVGVIRLPDDWSKIIGPTQNGTGIIDIPINGPPVDPPGPTGGLWVAERSQSYQAGHDYVVGFAPWLGRVGSVSDYTLVASLYKSDSTTNLPDINELIGVTSTSASIVPRSGDRVKLLFTGPLSTTPFDRYCIVLGQTGGDTGNYIEWYGASDSYPLGSGGYCTQPAGSWQVVTPLTATGSDDHNVIIHEWGTFPSGGTVSTAFEFPEGPAKHVVNPIISIVIDCSGSMADTNDKENKRFDTAYDFATQLLDYYSTGSHENLPTDETALFDIIIFGDSRYNPNLPGAEETNFDEHIVNPNSGYALLGSTSNITNSGSVLQSKLNLAKNSGLGGGTPLQHSVRLAAERLAKMESGRNKAIVVFTDGVATDDYDNPQEFQKNPLKSDDIINDYLLVDSDNPISVTSVLFYVEPTGYTDPELIKASQFLSYYATRTNGRFYTSVGTDGFDDIIHDLTTSTVWIQKEETREIDLKKDVLCKELSLNVTLPGQSTATVDIYTSTNDRPTDWNPLPGNPYVLYDSSVTPPVISIDRMLRYLRFIFTLSAGSLPIIDGGTLTYENFNQVDLCTVAFPTERPIQQLSLSFSRVPDMLPTGVYRDFAVGLGSSTNWDNMRLLSEYDRESIPARIRESTTTEDNQTYALRYGRYSGAELAVYVNGGKVPDDSYTMDGYNGTITFLSPKRDQDVVTITVVYDYSYRIQTRTRFTTGEFPVEFDYSWLYTLHPLYDTIYIDDEVYYGGGDSEGSSEEEPDELTVRDLYFEEEENMAFAYTVLAEPTYVPDSTTTPIITNNETGGKSYIRWILLHNATGAAYNVDMYKVPCGTNTIGTASTGNRFFRQVISSNESVQVEFPSPGMVLSNQYDSLVVAATMGNAFTVQVYGATE